MCEEPQKGQGCLRPGRVSVAPTVSTLGGWSVSAALGVSSPLLQQFSLPESLHVGCCLCWWLVCCSKVSPQGIQHSSVLIEHHSPLSSELPSLDICPKGYFSCLMKGVLMVCCIAIASTSDGG